MAMVGYPPTGKRGVAAERSSDAVAGVIQEKLAIVKPRDHMEQPTSYMKTRISRHFEKRISA